MEGQSERRRRGGSGGADENERGGDTRRNSTRITKGLFATWPSLGDTTPDLEGLKRRITSTYERRGLIAGVIARERHKDGSWHVHGYLKFDGEHGDDRGRTVLEHSELDNITGKHGNYQAARSETKVIKYCLKDGMYLQWGDIDIENNEKQRRAKKRMIGEKLINGETTVVEIVTEDPSLLMDFVRMQTNLDAYNSSKRTKTTRDIPQLIWLQGDPGIGKTTMAKAINNSNYIVPVPTTTGIWNYNGYQDQKVMIFDNLGENMKVPYEQLLRIVDNSVYLTRLSGTGMYISLTPKVVVITSVQSPSGVYGTQYDGQLERRITTYLVGRGAQPTTVWTVMETSKAMSTTVSEQTTEITNVLKIQ